jgi:hypothetical protein
MLHAAGAQYLIARVDQLRRDTLHQRNIVIYK